LAADRVAFSLDSAFYAVASCVGSATSQEQHKISKMNQWIEAVKENSYLPNWLTHSSTLPDTQ
jgi:hypothetical protein